MDLNMVSIQICYKKHNNTINGIIYKFLNSRRTCPK